MKKIIKLTESDLIRIIKQAINENDPKVGTGKKPKDSDRRLYTDENPNDTVSIKFRTKQDIVDTLNKESFKSKSHARQSQIINLIHQRLRVALERAKDPEVKKRLRAAFEYIESKKEASKRKTKEMKEGLHDTSWQNNEGDKVTLMDLLNATEDVPVERVSVEELKPHLLSWDGDEEEIIKIDSADLQYPILIFVENDGEFISIIDGHHRAQKAVRKGLKTIKAKVIPINDLPKDIRKVFSHMGRQEEMKEGELTEKCWAGYTQKGMKTMFGKRYPNCVKKESVEEETNEASSPAQQAAIAINMKKKGIEPKNETLYEDEYGSVEETNFVIGDLLTEAEYQGRKVQLGKIMQGDVKKSKVYVKNDKGKVVKVNFGFGGKSAKGKIMRIKKNNPERRKNFRARHNCDNPGPRWKPRYWACRTW
jgi:hypothetical protein